LSATAVVVGGLLLETTGYFFLAFSHAVDVLISKKMRMALLVFPVVSLTGTQLADVLSILSFYFVLYGVVETVYSYARTRKPDTLLIALGLSMIGIGTFFQWLSLLYLQVDVLLLLQIILKEMGLLILFTPVLRFAVGGVKIDGAV
jgi:signal transduction histidine kinase